METARLIAEKIEIVNFKIIKGQINSPFEFEVDKVKGHTFNLNFEMGFNLDKKLVKADFKVIVETKSTKSNIEEAKGEFHFVYVYFIENIENLVKLNQDNRVEVEHSLANALASISHSTSRGILMTRFQGTALENFIMPVINPDNLLSDTFDNL